MRTIQSLDLTGKRVIIRIDANVPMQDGKITSDKRLRACLPTILLALEKGAAVILLSHFGRPTEGEYDEQFSLAPVAVALSGLLGKDVGFERDWLQGVEVAPGQVVLCENVRFNVGEKACDEGLSEKMAALGDVFVNDAFATAHRAQSSTVGIAKYCKESCAGLLLSSELRHLEKALKQPAAPVVAIVGGAKVSSKLSVLKAIIAVADVLIPGGGIANTFLAASGMDVRDSLYEAQLVDEAQSLLELAKAQGKTILLPSDVVVATELSETATTRETSVNALAAGEKIFDMGSQTLAAYVEHVNRAKTIIWNGPVGVFEVPPFAKGTRVLTEAIAASGAFSLAGGGDTVAAIDTFSEEAKFGYVSTGGGAFLEYVEGKVLPAVAALED